jgi:hypothetical protein
LCARQRELLQCMEPEVTEEEEDEGSLARTRVRPRFLWMRKAEMSLYWLKVGLEEIYDFQMELRRACTGSK